MLTAWPPPPQDSFSLSHPIYRRDIDKEGSKESTGEILTKKVQKNQELELAPDMLEKAVKYRSNPSSEPEFKSLVRQI